MAEAQAESEQHPIGIYLKVWLLLFVLSTLSYMVDYFQFQGYLRWTLILIFMFLKAGFIIAVFMHMMWERLALVYAILMPPLCLLVFIALMLIESDHTRGYRIDYFGHELREPLPPQHMQGDHH